MAEEASEASSAVVDESRQGDLPVPAVRAKYEGENFLENENVLIRPHAHATTLSCRASEPPELLSILQDSFLSSKILQHLTLADLAASSLVCRSLRLACRSNALWKILLDRRWNVPAVTQPSDDSDNDTLKNEAYVLDYFELYQRAHLHPHDLWVYHENCVPPWDGIMPATACRIGSRTNRDDKNEGSNLDVCCACRIPQKTTQTDLKDATKETDETHRETLQHQQQAFATAATFHRKLGLDQYRDSMTPSFLTDLLFFNLTDPATLEGERELQALLQASRAQLEENHVNSNSSFSSMLLETTHHSWHQIRLVNPDWDRPLVFSFGVQRSDCFAVYPSQGYLKPGDSVLVTVSVRPLGSALAYSFERLNVEREALAADWANLYTREAHLPMCPFVIKYKFVNRAPGRTHLGAAARVGPPTARAHTRGGDTDLRRDEQITQSTADTLEHFWKFNNSGGGNDLTSHRSVYLSAHVHAHYNYWDFYQQLHSSKVSSTLSLRNQATVVAPNLQLVYPHVYKQTRTHLFQEQPEESHCSHCGHRMTLHHPSPLVVEASQEWAAHIEERERRRSLVARNIEFILKTLVVVDGDETKKPPKLKTHSESTSLLLSSIWAVVQTDKATPWVTSRKQLQSLSELEQSLDQLYQQLPVGGVIYHPWRRPGLYKFRTSTASVYSAGDDADIFCSRDVGGQDEPLYLETFRNLAHNPGSFCLGRQEDPNHLLDWSHVDSMKTRGKYAKNVTPFHRTGDSFMNDPISSFQAGLALIKDPRSLLVHGIFDRVAYPGAVIRRPKRLWRLRVPASSRKTTRHHDEDDRLYLEYNILRFMHGAPPSGIGRFPLTKIGFTSGREEGGESVLSILEFDLKKEVPQASSNNSRTHGGPPPPRQPDQEGGRAMNPQQAALAGGNLRGPRLFQLLWVLGAQAGLIVIDDRESPSIFVERSILIACEWISLSLSLGPLLCTLVARALCLIHVRPTDYYLDRLPFELSDEMRWLTSRECGYVACLVLFVWMLLARWSERHVGRDFSRAMAEHVQPKKHLQSWLWDRLLRIWDAFCPLFLQRRMFEPYWNKRTTTDANRLTGGWRSHDLHISDRVVCAKVGIQEGNKHGACLLLGKTSVFCKVLVGIALTLGSFCSTSPHFWLNAISIFSCSISLGMSASIACLERGRINISVRNTTTGSFLKELNLVTVAILALLVGQLVGSSGGSLFLAEFIVTSISLILGGAGTVSASSMESWFGFFGLSCISFWGYLFGRIACPDGLRQKRAGYASILLSNTVLLIFAFWVFIFWLGTFESYVGMVIKRWPDDSSKASGHSYGHYMARIQ